MIKVDEKEYQKIICENQVLKNMIKNMDLFASRAESMSYEGFFKTSKSMLDSFVKSINERTLIEEDIVDYSLLEHVDSGDEEDNEEDNEANIEEDKIVDVTCDICMESCMDSIQMNHEHLTIKGNWGYGSDKDGETWEAHVCEKCSDEYLSNLILFQKSLYMGKSKEILENINKVNKRKRKIRKSVGSKIEISVQVDNEENE
jgi:hypothetical protein